MTTAEPTPVLEPALLDRVAVRNAGSSVMAMTLFVASEAVFFGAFFGIYASAYTQTKVWPPLTVPDPAMLLPTLAAAVLLVSGGTMALALRRLRARSPGAALPWMWATMLCAVAFVVLVLAGYPGLHFGIGAGIYESLFYTISAIALAHVAGGIVLLGLVLSRAAELALHREALQAASIYWYFVVVLGIVIYLLLYVAVVA